MSIKRQLPRRKAPESTTARALCPSKKTLREKTIDERGVAESRDQRVTIEESALPRGCDSRKSKADCRRFGTKLSPGPKTSRISSCTPSPLSHKSSESPVFHRPTLADDR